MSQSSLEEVPQPGCKSALTSADARAETIDARNGVILNGTASRSDATVRLPRVVEAITARGLLDRLSPQPAPVVAAAADPGATTSDACLPGSRLGQYELVRQIGRGGMGTVWLARDLRLGRLVAIKLLLRLGYQDNARFLTEARVTARCNHENIVVIYDVGEHDGEPYMVFEYVAGQTLRAWLDERTQRSDEGVTPIEPSVAANLMIPVARALAYAHDMGIVHRDLKPANIILTDAGTIKVLDFGIAKLVVGDDPGSLALHLPLVTEPGVIMGTLPYMSPEQLEDSAVDHRTDLWAVGIMLYQMVTGVHPVIHDGGNLQHALLDIASLDLAMPSVEERRSDLGPLAGIIDRCLLKDRAHRTRDAHVLLQELEAIAAGRRIAALSHDGNPFAGLASFQEADADLFYGRTREIGAVVARLRSCPLVVLAGPSGVGKSSLVRAGVVPVLKRSGEGWDTFIVRPGRSPLGSLGAMLLDLASSGSESIAASFVASFVADGDERAASLRAAPGQLGAGLRAHAHSKRRHVLVFVDQFEELYTLCADPGERAAFLACLDGMADDASSPLRVLVSIRSDFLERLAEHRELADRISHGLMFVPPLDRDGLRDALVCPVEAADYRYEDPGIVDEILAGVAAAPGSLPLLQFAAAQLWIERDRDRRLVTRASYTAMGGIAGTLAGHADRVVAECTQREQATVRALFLRLVTPERTRAIVPVSELYELSTDADEIHRVVEHLVRSRLLVGQIMASAGGTSAGGTIEIVHESLIHGWPLLRHWLDETQEDAAFLEQLRNASKQWQLKGYAPDLLWRGEAMQEAKLWHSRYRGELPDLQRAYLSAVFALAKAKRRKLLGAAAISFLSSLVVVASIGLYTTRKAQQEATAQAHRVEQQLALTQAAEKTAKAAEATANTRRNDLATKNTDLVAAIDEAKRAQQTAEQAQLDAEQARLRAEKSKRQERRSRRKATDAAAAAEAAASDAMHAKDKLEALLDQEKKRVEELEKATRGVKIVPDAAVESKDRTPWNTGVAVEVRQAARDMFLEGNRLFQIPLFSRAAEKYAEALGKWKHPVFYFNLAIAQLNLGQNVEAHRSLESALKFGAEPLGDQFEEARKLLAEIEPNLGRIRVNCPTPGAEVMLDGETLFIGPGSVNMWVLARAHEVTAKKQDYGDQSERVIATAGAQQTVTLSLHKLIENRP